MKLRAMSLRKIKMAWRSRIVKIGALLLSQFCLLGALNFQLFEMVTAYKMMERKRNLSLAAYLSARKTYLERKKRHLRAPRVHGFSDSLVLFNLVCIKVDVLTLHLSFEICETTTEILYFIDFFPLKSRLHRSGSHLVSWKTKSLRMSKLTFQPGLKFLFDYMRFFFRFSGLFG